MKKSKNIKEFNKYKASLRISCMLLKRKNLNVNQISNLYIKEECLIKKNLTNYKITFLILVMKYKDKKISS